MLQAAKGLTSIEAFVNCRSRKILEGICNYRVSWINRKVKYTLIKRSIEM